MAIGLGGMDVHKGHFEGFVLQVQGDVSDGKGVGIVFEASAEGDGGLGLPGMREGYGEQEKEGRVFHDGWFGTVYAKLRPVDGREGGFDSSWRGNG